MEIALEQRQGEARGVLSDALRLTAVHLKVSELERSAAFYRDVIGFEAREVGPAELALGAPGGEDLIVLHERPGALKQSRRSGLYHVALLYPSRLELARVAQRIQTTDTPIEGASDHGTHEAIYLPDPDGNGLELAQDRPPESWPQLADVTAIRPRPLDIGGLFNLVSGREPVAEADATTQVGHVHLRVGAIDDSLHFYRDLIGFDLITEIPGSAAFVSAGGYHHHLAFNVWQGRGAPPASEDAAGLQHWSLELPAEDDLTALAERLTAGGAEFQQTPGLLQTTDPWGNHLQITTP